MKYKAVIFDMDGTLLNTLDDITDSVNYVIGRYGYPSKSIDEIRDYVGNGAKRLLEQCFTRKLDDRYFTRMLGQYKQHYLENCLNKTRPYPQTIELLHKLREMGVKLGIVSNKPDATVKRLNSLFFEEYITVALGEHLNEKTKPEPDLVFMALEQMDVDPRDALYVGDSEVDILTARNAEIPCVSVTWGFRDADALKAAGAGCIINRPLELLEHLDIRVAGGM